ncbi:MAG: TolC family protein [Microscillaceae bacterium]|nr:TolC family protein [Microscillaceae bacterium]
MKPKNPVYCPMNAYSLLALFWFFSFSCLWAQVEDPDSTFRVDDNTSAIAAYDLEGCLQYALRYSESLRLGELDIRAAQADVGENIARGLPQVSAEASFQDNFKIQRSFVPAFLFDDEAPENLFVPVQFQPKYAGSASITLQQLIFDFSYLIGLRAARMYEDLTRTQTQLNKVEIVANVSKAYYAVLVARERIGLLEANYRRLDTLLRETRALYENGFSELLDVQRIEVAYNNILIEKKKAEGAVLLTEQVLKFQMGMPGRDSLAVIGALNDIRLDENLLEVAGQASPKSRIEYQVLEKQKAIREVGLSYARSLYYPSFSGVVSYGTNTGVNSFGDWWRFNERWFGFGFYGFQLNIPIFDGMKRRHTLSKYQIDIDRAEIQMAQFERVSTFEIDQARITLSESILNLENQKRNMELAAEVARVTKIKYQNGVGSNLEVVEAESAYKEAETNYYATLYEALVRKVDLEKAAGTLYNEQ